MKKVTIKSDLCYNFDHKKVKERFEGNPIFVNEFCVYGEDVPVAVYSVEKPNRKKGHKDFLLLSMDPLREKIIIRGMNKKEMEKERYQRSVLCKNCNIALFSKGRHVMTECGCENNTMVDGGKAYFRCGGKDMSKVEYIVIDLLTDKIVPQSKFRNVNL